MGLPRIISFSGRKGSGKTELANICSKYGYNVIYFADNLKDMVCNCLDISRDTLESLKDKEMKFDLSNKREYIANELQVDIKEIGDLGLFKSIREILQILGTDIIRRYNPDWHINKTMLYLENNKDMNFCIGDCRFLNEKNMIEDLGGECWYIIRPNQLNISNHISETELNWTMFKDKIIINTMEKRYLIKIFDDYLYKRNKDIKIDCFNCDKLKSNDFLNLNEKKVYLLGFLCGSNVFIKDNVLTIKNDRILKIKYLQDELKNSYNINTIDSINIYNPFIIENLKLWNVFHNKSQVLDIIKNNVEFRKMWILGLIDSCDTDIDTLSMTNLNDVLEYISNQYNIEFNNDINDMYDLYLKQDRWLKLKKRVTSMNYYNNC